MPSSVLAERVRAAIRLLYPDEMTPQAKRVLESILDDSDKEWAEKLLTGFGRLSQQELEAPFATYCMAPSPEGHHCALPKNHQEDYHYGGSPMLDEVEWVRWSVGQEVTDGE